MNGHGGKKVKNPVQIFADPLRHLMGLLYRARMARYDNLRPVQSLATFLREWDVNCDKRLLRLMSYVWSTLHWCQYMWIRDLLNVLGPICMLMRVCCRMSENFQINVRRPPGGRGTISRQTALSHSTPEAEFAAWYLAHQKTFLPALDLYDRLPP